MMTDDDTTPLDELVPPYEHRPRTQPRPNPIMEELFAGYQSLAWGLLRPFRRLHAYRSGYMDGWADAMRHAANLADGAGLIPADEAFPLLRPKRLRLYAIAELARQRTPFISPPGV